MKYGLRIFTHSLYTEMIEAIDVTEDLLPDLVVKCPECNQFIDFVKAKQRSKPVTGGVANVSAHFKHEKDTNRTKICIHRVAKYNSETIQKHLNKQREQRMRFIQREFWRLFVNYYESVGFRIVSEIINESGVKAPTRKAQNEALRKLARLLVESFRSANVEDSRHNIKEMMGAVFEGAPIILGIDPQSSIQGLIPSTGLQKAFAERVSKQLDKNLQLRISLEILDFLLLKRSIPILEELFLLAIYVVLDAAHDVLKDVGTLSAIGFVGKNAGLDKNGQFIKVDDPATQAAISLNFLGNPYNAAVMYEYTANHILLWIAMLPWNLEIERICKERKKFKLKA